MNLLTRWYGAYRAWEDRYIAVLDTLDAGGTIDPDWTRTAYGRRFARRSACLSASERRQMRDFIWRFRGWRGWSVIAALVVADCVIGVLIHLGAPDKFGPVEAAVLINLCVLGLGLGILGVWFNPGYWSRLRGSRILILPVVVSVGAILGASLSGVVRGDGAAGWLSHVGKTQVLTGLGVGVALTVLLALIIGLRNRELRAVNAQLAAETDRQRLGHEVTTSRLRLLQAQIEPHFLFNTLGAVQQLAEGRAPEAAALTAHLIRFLRNAMGRFSDVTTVGDEVDIVDSYLRIMQSRLGARLAFSIDVPQALRTCRIQPTLLLNFVENAIKHGVEPSLQGGSIRVSASASGDRVTIEVADTGPGMADTIGDGRGLRNAREQLALAYGGRGSLELLENEPSGLVVRLHIPRDQPA